jgi:hypothetical protein
MKIEKRLDNEKQHATRELDWALFDDGGTQEEPATVAML